MASLCQWPFSSFLLASSLLNSSFYFNLSGTLQSSAVVSYDIINIDKKLNLFAMRQKIEFGLCKKLENFVITKTLKMPLSGDKILCSLYFDSLSFVGSSYFANVTLPRAIIVPLWLLTSPINVIGYTKNFACLICEQGFKNEKEARIIVAGTNQKGYATSCELLYTNFCERNHFLFCTKRYQRFLYRY